jgi:hypothetical protein
MFRSGWIVIAVALAGSALWPGAGDAARRLSVSASPAIVEPGDAVTFTMRGGKGTCRLVARGDRRGSRAVMHGLGRGKLVLTVPAAARPGSYVTRATCGRRSATARFTVHGPAGPDFALALDPVGRASKRAVTRIYRVRATNVAPWAATSVRLCARVAARGGTITGVKDKASLKNPSTACSIIARLPAGRAAAFAFRVRSAKRRNAQVAATVIAANSSRASRTFTAGASVRGSKATVDRVAPSHRARAALAPSASCTPASRIGVAFVADDSGSMVESDPAELRGQAISVGLDQLPDGSLAGATRFADESSPLFGVGEVNPTTRPALKSQVAGLASAGITDYEQAFQGAQAQLAGMGAADRKAVIFLSDGQPSYDDYTTDQAIANAGIPIFTIGFGSADAGILADIAARSGGQSFVAGSADDLQSIFARVIAKLNCAAASVSTQLALDPGETQTVPFAVGYDDGEFRALAAWSGGHLAVTAVRPDASVMSASALHGGERVSDNPTYALLTGVNPAVGGWQLRIAADVGNTSTVHVSIDVFKKGLPPLATHAPLNPKTEGRSVDACLEMYKNGKATTKHVRGGDQTNFDRSASLYQVCAGFGTPDDVQWSLGMKCAFVSATTVLAGGKLADAGLQTFDALCDGTDTLLELQSGHWAGVVGGKACDVFGSLFSEVAGIVAAGLTVETGPGALFTGDVVYRVFAAGFKLACGGLFAGGAQTLGIKLEDKHEADIARDISAHGKCLRYTRRFGFVNWNSADCGS